MNLACPLCSGVLLSECRWRIPLDVCASCSAVWFDAGEFGPYLVRADRRPGSTSEPRFLPRNTALALRCPQCRTLTLTAFEAQGINVFACSHCRGVVLPISETRRFRNRPRGPARGPHADPERYVEDAEIAVDVGVDLLPDAFDLLEFLFPDL